eukprot:Nk52_evm35s2531 gene=Nk52_evmTU35s2531
MGDNDLAEAFQRSMRLFADTTSGNRSGDFLNGLLQAATSGNTADDAVIQAQQWLGIAGRIVLKQNRYKPYWGDALRRLGDDIEVQCAGWYEEFRKRRKEVYKGCWDDQPEEEEKKKGRELVWDDIEESIVGKTFDVSVCRLNMTKLPKEVCLAANLSFLDCSFNRLEQLPSEIGNCINLEELCCPNNLLTELPTGLSSCRRLHTINCCSNRITSLPVEFGNLAKLTVLRCGDNQLSELPESLSQCKSLEYIDCSSNKPGFILPRQIFTDCPCLFRVECRSNHITELYEDIGEHAKSLNMLDYSQNQLVSLPENLGKCLKMGALDVSHNQITQLPESLMKCVDIKSLRINHNSLQCLPKNIGDLKELIHIAVNNNQLKGLPESMGGLKSLERFECDCNQIKTLPESLGACGNLLQLHCADNRLTEIPISLANCVKLRKLSLMRNPDLSFSGIPVELRACKNLQVRLDKSKKPSDVGVLGLTPSDRAGIKQLQENEINLNYVDKMQ